MIARDRFTLKQSSVYTRSRISKHAASASTYLLDKPINTVRNCMYEVSVCLTSSSYIQLLPYNFPSKGSRSVFNPKYFGFVGSCSSLHIVPYDDREHRQPSTDCPVLSF
jgi:hypothetical protein